MRIAIVILLASALLPDVSADARHQQRQQQQCPPQVTNVRVDQVGSKGRVLVKWDVDSESKDCRAIFKVILKKLTEKSDHSDEYNSIEKFDLGPAIKSQAGVKDRSYAFSDVPSGAPVTFEVQATSAGSKKGASSKPARSAPFTVKRGCSEAAAPVAPESVSFHSLDGSDKIMLSWSAPPNDDSAPCVAGFEVQASYQPSGEVWASTRVAAQDSFADYTQVAFPYRPRLATDTLYFTITGKNGEKSGKPAKLALRLVPDRLSGGKGGGGGAGKAPLLESCVQKAMQGAPQLEIQRAEQADAIAVTIKRPTDSDDGVCVTSFDLTVLDASSGARLASAALNTSHPLEDATSAQLPAGSPVASALLGGQPVTIELAARADDLKGAPLRLERVKLQGAAGAGAGAGARWLCGTDGSVAPQNALLTATGGQLGFTWEWPQGDDDQMPACLSSASAQILDADSRQPVAECAAALTQATAGRPVARERGDGSCTGTVWTVPASPSGAGCSSDALLGGPAAGAGGAAPGGAPPAQRRVVLKVTAFDGTRQVSSGESKVVRLVRTPAGAAACYDDVKPGRVEITKVVRPALTGPKLLVPQDVAVTWRSYWDRPCDRGCEDAYNVTLVSAAGKVLNSTIVRPDDPSNATATHTAVFSGLVGGERFHLRVAAQNGKLEGPSSATDNIRVPFITSASSNRELILAELRRDCRGVPVFAYAFRDRADMVKITWRRSGVESDFAGKDPLTCSMPLVTAPPSNSSGDSDTSS